MPTLVGVLLLVFGLMFLSMIVHDHRNHGGIYMDPRPTGYLVPTPVAVAIWMMTGTLLLGGMYLLAPAISVCSKGFMP